MESQGTDHPISQVDSAQEKDLPSLSTIVARSFHPANPYIAACFPDTSALRAWWTALFTHCIATPTCQPLVIRDPSPGAKEGDVVGILTLTAFDASDRGAGAWTSPPGRTLTSDHDGPKVTIMINNMATYREQLMLGRPHYMIELFGVDHEFRGQGVGKALLKRACEIADDAGLEIFVQANGSAKGVYEKQGFRVEGVEVMPGDEAYEEHLLVRPVKGP